MKTIVVLLFAALLFTDLDKIGKINSAKAEAKKAFLAGDFTTAIKKYSYLIDSLGVNEDEVRANLASAYFQANDTTGALNNYQRLTQSANKKISSVANQQLGVMANNQEKLEESLNYFKQALKAFPENDEARYNYEIVKKKLEEKMKQDQQKNKDQKDQDKKDDQKKDQKDQNKDDKKDQEKKDQEKKDQEKKDQEKKDQDKKDQKEKDPKDQKEKEQKEKEQKEKEEQEKNKDKKDMPPSVSEKLKEMQMSEEKAKMILEAMKNQEVQYLQQNKRKATKPKDKGKPDW
ncbi:MAG: tetratricopeptide repeat protein [Cyclobacteriaceae bacterium]